MSPRTAINNSSSTESNKIVLEKSAVLHNQADDSDAHHPRIKTYRIRYFLLLMFALLSATNAFQWIQYAIIESYVVEYYGIQTFWVNCTSTVYMILYVIGIIPATWMLDNYGLRTCLIFGSLLNASGALIKCLSIGRHLWVFSMIGQVSSAAAQLFILNIPPLLAATWFPSSEVSRTTALGVFGNQIGIALGFFIPPMLMPRSHENSSSLSPHEEEKFISDTEHGLRILFFGCAGITVAVFLLIILFFRNRPEYPPSEAQIYAAEMRSGSEGSFTKSIKKLFTNRNFVLLFVSYGLNTGVFYAISTVLAQLVESAFGSSIYVQEAGYMGVAITIAGIFGSIVCGSILGMSKKFKLVTLVLYLCSLLGTVAFTLGLKYRSITSLYLISSFLGFFMTGYLPIGFEFAAEVSYPQPEGTSAGLLNASAQIFGIIFTYGSSEIINRAGHIYANSALIVALVFGSALTALVSNDLKRQHAQLGTIPVQSSINSS